MSGWANRSKYNNGDNNNHSNGSGGAASEGILRKAPVIPPHVVNQQHLDDLLVFGYACKIFRDDSRATQIDHGKHLIPWMGDASLKIDRYDVRATMSDIAPYEAPAGGFTDQLATLTLAEQRAEQLCEEERYHSLYNNDFEEEMYKDETLKRLHRERSSTYGQVAFDYNAAGSNPVVVTTRTEIADKPAKDPDDDPFTVNPRFYVPPTIEVPESMKLHAVIEKTAKFIAAQGPQMEILIKAKQSNNPQFEFLNQTNILNPYYKHVLNAVKNGYYPVEDPEPTVDSNANDSSAAPQDGTHTQPTVAVQPPVIVPQIKYKPSADCAYTQLISKIKGVPMPDNADGTGSPSESNDSARDSPDAFSREATLKHIKDFQQFKKNNQSTTASNDIGRHAGHKSNGPLLASPMPDANRGAPPKTPAIKEKAGVEVKKISGALLLAQCYNSDTEEENDENDASTAKPIVAAAKPVDQPQIDAKMPFDIPIPPAELQNIIDKTAAYVLKNGKEFEEILRTKNDQRFSFLMYTDIYNRYYVYKVTGAICSGPVVAAEAPKEPPKSVSFSIKPKEETSSLPLRPVLPQEQSSDEEETSPSNIAKPVVIAATTSPATNSCAAAVSSGGLLPTPSPKVLLPTPILTGSTPILPICHDPPAKPTAIATNRDLNAPDLNLSDASLRDALLDADDIRKGVAVVPTVEQRSNDRLAQAARDKMGAMSREKQLQLERRKKAMAFLNQMKTNSAAVNISASAVTPSTPVVPDAVKPSDEVVVVIDCPENHRSENGEDNGGDKCADDNVSVHSVHSVHSSPARSPVIVLNGGIVSDDDDDEDDDNGAPNDNADAKSTDSEKSRRRTSSRKRSRSPSSSSSRRHKHKKSKHHRQHAKKKSSGRRSRSRSSSVSRRERRSSSRGAESRRGTTSSSSYRSSRHKSSRHRNS